MNNPLSINKMLPDLRVDQCHHQVTCWKRRRPRDYSHPENFNLNQLKLLLFFKDNKKEVEKRHLKHSMIKSDQLDRIRNVFEKRTNDQIQMIIK